MEVPVGFRESIINIKSEIIIFYTVLHLLYRRLFCL